MMSLRGAKRRGNLFLRNGLLRRTLSVLLAMTIGLLSFQPCQAAIRLDGVNDYIDIKTLSLSNTSNFTISTWVNLNSTPAPYATVISLEESMGFLRIDINSSRQANGYIFTGAQNYIGLTTLNLNQWYNLTYTRNGTDYRFFADGVLRESRSLGNPVAGSGIEAIGARNTTGGNYNIDGLIDDTKIYNRPLNNGDILALYNSRSKRPSGSLANGLVAHYEMDDDAIGEITAQAKDSSGNLNHGQFFGFDNLVSNGFSTNVPAQIGTGYSLELDGVNDHVSFGAGTLGSTILNGTKAVTITAWIKSTALDTAKYDNVVFVSRVGPATNSNIWLNIRGDGVDSRKVLIGGRSQNADSFQEKTSTTAITSNTWTHVTGILDYENDEINLAIDGNLETATPVIFGSSTYVHSGTPSQPDSISSTNYVTTYPFTGLIKDVRIYNKVLSLPEISFIYNGSGLDPGTSNLQALWTFDNDSAVKDSSGNNNHGLGVGGESLKYTEGILRR